MDVTPLHQARVGRADQLLAEVNEHQVVLEDAVVKHVLGGLAQVDDPLGQGRRLYAVGHLLRVARTGRVVVEVYLGVDPEVPDDACDRVPRHLREVSGFRRNFLSNSHLSPLSTPATAGRSRSLAPACCDATWALC